MDASPATHTIHTKPPTGPVDACIGAVTVPTVTSTAGVNCQKGALSAEPAMGEQWWLIQCRSA